MAPSNWKTNADIIALKALREGKTLFSRWTAIRAAVAEYEGMRDDDLNGRGATLTKIESAIRTWTGNQDSFTTVVKNKDLVADKRVALARLQALILVERQELAPRPAVPLAPVITRAAAPALSIPSAPTLMMSPSTTAAPFLAAASISTTTSASLSAAPRFPISTSRAIPIRKAVPIKGGAGTQIETQQKDCMRSSDFSESFAHSWKNPVIQQIGGVWQNEAGAQLLGEGSVAIDGTQLNAFQQNFRVYVHFTKKAYQPGIFHGGPCTRQKTGHRLAQ